MWEIKDCPKVYVKIGAPLFKSENTNYLKEINDALTQNGGDPAMSLADVDEKIPSVREAGFVDGKAEIEADNNEVLQEINRSLTMSGLGARDSFREIADTIFGDVMCVRQAEYDNGRRDGANDTNAQRDANDAAYLNDINSVLAEYNGTPAKDLDTADEAVRDTINKAELEAQTLGYTQGVNITNAERNGLDESRLAEINTALAANGATSADTLDGVDEKITEVHAAGYLAGGNAGYAAGFQAGDLAGYGRGTLDTIETRDALDESRLAEINVALTENGGTAADTLDGVNEKIPEVHAAGVKSEYDRFWDEYQQNGDRTSYAGAFAGCGWTVENFNPKYSLNFGDVCNYAFVYSGIAGDLSKLLEDLGLSLDTANMTGAHGLFQYADKITKVPEINISKCGASNSSLFQSCLALVTIDKLVVAANNAWAGTFNNCKELQNLTIEGTIGTTGLNLSAATKLSKESITSVINALSSTTSGLAVTFSKTAVNAAFETSVGAADGSSSDLWLTMMGVEGYNHPEAVCVKPSGWAVNLA